MELLSRMQKNLIFLRVVCITESKFVFLIYNFADILFSEFYRYVVIVIRDFRITNFLTYIGEYTQISYIRTTSQSNKQYTRVMNGVSMLPMLIHR